MDIDHEGEVREREMGREEERGMRQFCIPSLTRIPEVYTYSWTSVQTKPFTVPASQLKPTVQLLVQTRKKDT